VCDVFALLVRVFCKRLAAAGCGRPTAVVAVVVPCGDVVHGAAVAWYSTA
jgi:hypothetical protein